MRLNHTPVAIQTKNIRRPLERAKHQNNSPILLQVSDRLHSASVEIQISHGSRPQNAKRVQPLRRKVHMPASIQRRRRHKKYTLRLNKLPRNIVDFGTSLSHGYSCIFRANSPRGTETCSPVERFLSANASACTSFSPTIKIYFAPAFVAVSNDFFSRKLSSPRSTTRSCRRNSRASRAASPFIPAIAATYTSGLRSTPSAVSFNDITSRSSPMANPIPGAAGPPRASDSPSYRPPPRIAFCAPSAPCVNSNAVRV